MRHAGLQGAATKHCSQLLIINFQADPQSAAVTCDLSCWLQWDVSAGETGFHPGGWTDSGVSAFADVASSSWGTGTENPNVVATS